MCVILLDKSNLTSDSPNETFQNDLINPGIAYVNPEIIDVFPESSNSLSGLGKFYRMVWK